MMTHASPVQPHCGASAMQGNNLPSSAGLGLKSEHFHEILETRPDIGFFEIHAENYMVDGGPYHHYLTRIRENYPISIHGVGLSIGGLAVPDVAHLDRLAILLDRYAPLRSEEHTSELQSLIRNSYAVFCCHKK